MPKKAVQVLLAAIPLTIHTNTMTTKEKHKLERNLIDAREAAIELVKVNPIWSKEATNLMSDIITGIFDSLKILKEEKNRLIS